jgi:hypothetical protein
MPNAELEEFARILVQQVRDGAVQTADIILRPDVRIIIAQRWRQAAAGGSLEAIAGVLIPDIVDCAIAELLRAIDQELLQLTFRAANGKTVDLTKDGLGELEGWYMGSEGWRSEYSHQRFVDDFTDLK